MNVLKKSALLCMLALLLVSCNNDDGGNTTNNTPTSIVGNWKMISLMSDGVEYVEPGDCLDKYFITENTSRYLEYYSMNNTCIADEEDLTSYPILEYSYNGETFIFNGSTYQIIEVNENTIKWSETYIEDGNTVTDIETLERE